MGENDPTIPNPMSIEHGEYTSAKNPSGIPSREEHQMFGKLAGEALEATPVGGRHTPLETAQNRINTVVDEYRNNPHLNPADLARERAYVANLEAKQAIYDTAKANGDIENIEEILERTLRRYIDSNDRNKNVGDLISEIKSIARDREERAMQTTVTGNRPYEAVYKNLIRSGVEGVADYMSAVLMATRNHPDEAAILRKTQLSMLEKDYLPRTYDGFGDELDAVLSSETRRIRESMEYPQARLNQRQNEAENVNVDPTLNAIANSLVEGSGRGNLDTQWKHFRDAEKSMNINALGFETNGRFVGLTENESDLAAELFARRALINAAAEKKGTSDDSKFAPIADKEGLKELSNSQLEIIFKKQGVVEAASLMTTIMENNYSLDFLPPAPPRRDGTIPDRLVPRSFYQIDLDDEYKQFKTCMAVWLVDNGYVTVSNNGQPLTEQQKKERDSLASDAVNIAWNFMYVSNFAEAKYTYKNPKVKALLESREEPPPKEVVNSAFSALAHPADYLRTSTQNSSGWSAYGTWAEGRVRNREMKVDKLDLFPEDLMGDALTYTTDAQGRSLFSVLNGNGEKLIRGHVDRANLVIPDFGPNARNKPFKEYVQNKVKPAATVMRAYMGEKQLTPTDMGGAFRALKLEKKYREHAILAHYGFNSNQRKLTPRGALNQGDLNRVYTKGINGDAALFD